MKKNKLTTFVIAFNNLKLRPVRTACLIIFVTVIAFLLLCSNILSVSLENGMSSISNRLGADIMVVPEGSDQKIEGALLRGDPGTFYFSDKVLGKVKKVEGVDKVSPQLFIASLSAACCSEDIQLIGIDVNTDFVIQPWISNAFHGELTDNSIVVGSGISAEPNDELMFFGRTYHVAAKLNETGMGFDTSVFLNMNAAKQAVNDYKKRGGDVAFNGQDEISSVIIDVKDGYDISKTARAISLLGIDADVITSQNMLSSISGDLNYLLRFLKLQVAALWFLSFVILVIIFAAVINERKKEFGILRAIGVTRMKLVVIILTEASIISLTGAVCGNFLASLLLFPFNTFICNKIRLPYLQPSLLSIVAIIIFSIIVSYLSGVVASIFSTVKLGRLETYEMMRGDG